MADHDEQISIEVPGGAAGDRLDRFLAREMERLGRDVSRAALQRWIRDGNVRVNGKVVKPRHTVEEGERVEIEIPPEAPVELVPEPIDFEVLYEDEDIIVVDKPHGLVVHPGSGNRSGTLVNGLLHHCQGKLCELAGEDRPGIVHRLDKDTSGCLVAAKTDRAYHSLVSQFSGRETGKEYLAITSGVPTEERGRIENRIGRHPVNRQKMAVVSAPAGKEAITDFEIVREDEGGAWSAVRCVIHTGRTHQIRVHLKECLHAPILGDPIYGQPSRPKVKVSRLLLHAHRLRIRHPEDGRELEWEAPIPPEFTPFL